jgi:hypothetical protein
VIIAISLLTIAIAHAIITNKLMIITSTKESRGSDAPPTP